MNPNVILVGTGVVGRAILQAHIDAAVAVAVADLDEAALKGAVDRLSLDRSQWQISDVKPSPLRLPTIEIVGPPTPGNLPTIVIESIAEKLEIKQSFFHQTEKRLGDAILCSNTSTLRIADCGRQLIRPRQLCGMHFFMPVYNRPAVELVHTPSTGADVIQACEDHVRRIGKTPIVVPDSPGFIVNRLLSPYLNEALLLLSRGVKAERLEQAARQYGMPMSPLELIDWIGTRTMFDAGRAIWQAFPNRFDPSPILGGLIKAKRLGRAAGAGIYDYRNGERSDRVAEVTEELGRRYQRNTAEFTDEEVMLLLAIPMWIEAALACREGTIASLQQIDLAMKGGLGYQSNVGWLEFFDQVGNAKMLSTIDRFAPTTKSLQAPAPLVEMLTQNTPTTALQQFAVKT